ncbi:MAG: adenylate/guanylate cyclase domain-containing protein [Betaproteobacteria bacterium]|nr:MAG: adenylate/guanylate cyclase domain-containing protein [Betaproteobacteria bacterium]
MTNPAVQRRLAAILAIDIVGFSRLMGADEEGTLARLKLLRADLIDPAIAGLRGRIFKTTGDGILAEFASVVDAVQCAAKVQTAIALREAAEPPERRMALRVGINLGDIIIEGDDIYGDGVNIAARLEGICEPGSVAISASAYEQVRDKLPLRFVDRGEHTVKNIARPVRVYGLDLGAPSAAPKKAAPARKKWRRALLIAAVAALAVGSALWYSFSARLAKPADAAAATIAVLPFANQSGDPKRDYFSDGVTEDIITALGRFSGVRVSARNAVQAYKGRNASPAEISRDLGVRYLVQGSVRQADARVRVAVELSDASKGTLLWSEHYEGEGKEVFEIQDRIVKNIVGALAVKLTSLEQQRAAAKLPESMDAYDLVLRARELMRTSDRKHIREAMALLNQALQLSPKYAEAHAALASCELQRALFGWVEDPAAAVRRAEAAAQRALAADDPGANARALGVLASLHTFTGNFDAALGEADRAIALNASDALAYQLRGGALMWLGRIPESIAATEAARRFDPRLSSEADFNLGMAYYLAGRYRDALAAFNDSLRVEPDLVFLQAGRAAAAAEMQDTAQAEQAAAAVRRLDPFFKVETYGRRLVNPAHGAKLQEGLRKAGL